MTRLIYAIFLNCDAFDWKNIWPIISLGDLLFMKHADGESINLSGQLSIQKFSQCIQPKIKKKV